MLRPSMLQDRGIVQMASIEGKEKYIWRGS